jgi:uncharacterized cupredoxin-like copper-binding protein
MTDFLETGATAFYPEVLRESLQRMNAWRSESIYVADVVLGPDALTSLPFYDPGLTGFGLEVVPSPGPNLIAWPLAVTSVTGEGDKWGNTPNAHLIWATAGGTLDPGLPGITYVQDQLDKLNVISRMVHNNIDAGFDQNTQAVADTPLALWTDIDVTDGGAGIGTRSVRYRIYYIIEPVTTFASHYSITALNPVGKTITVNGDASALTDGNAAVVGSTGNNADYTITDASLFDGTVTVALGSPDNFDIVPNTVSVLAQDITFAVRNADAFAITHEFLLIKTTDTAAAIIAAAPLGGTFDESGYDVRVDSGDIAQHGTYTSSAVTLEAGHYVMVCNEPGHAHSGMALDFTVRDAGGDESIVTVAEDIPDDTADGWIKQ